MGILDGKVAIVTGAGSGIGRGIVTELVRHGAKVVAAGREQQSLDETVAQASSLGEVSSYVADVTDSAAVKALVAATVERYGSLTTMVNNAGVLLPGGILEVTEENYNAQMDVNVRGTVYGCQAAIPAIREAGGGSIVNIGSINSFVAEARLAIYTASKGAILMLSKSIALDLAPEGIRCNVVCPGFVDTALNVPHYELFGTRQELEDSLPTFQPIGRAIEPSEIAGAVVFLASDLSTAVTGTAVVVDGGVTMKA